MDPCLAALQPESDPPGRAGTPRRRPGTQPSRADVSVDRTGREMPHRVGTPAGSSRPPHRLSRRSLLLAGVGLAGTTPAAALARLTDSYAAPGPPLYTPVLLRRLCGQCPLSRSAAVQRPGGFDPRAAVEDVVVPGLRQPMARGTGSRGRRLGPRPSHRLATGRRRLTDPLSGPTRGPFRRSAPAILHRRRPISAPRHPASLLGDERIGRTVLTEPPGPRPAGF